MCYNKSRYTTIELTNTYHRNPHTILQRHPCSVHQREVRARFRGKLFGHGQLCIIRVMLPVCIRVDNNRSEGRILEELRDALSMAV